VLIDAIKRGASDVHFEPYEKIFRVRTRLDGVLSEVAQPPVALANKVCARLKVMSRLDIAERRVPQDGRIKMRLSKNRAIDFRVSTCPTLFGEKIVLRILDPSSAKLGIDALGYDERQKAMYLKHLSKPYGMILVTGPTGSGKTVSLYTGLNILNTEYRNISTAEDPAEINLPGVNQVNVNPKVGLTFASALKAFLRQDPDVIMVGEIRDRETAEISVRAALVGRLLFSTLHTNDSAGAVARLTDMGVEPFLLASTLELIIAQRLVRRICVDCRESTGLDSALFRTLQTTPEFVAAMPVLQRRGVLSGAEDPLARVRLFRGRGCDRCNGTGYRGRLGVFELLHVSDPIRALILDRRRAASAIRAAAIAEGMTTMFEDALAKAFLGETTLDEAVRATA
jgi:type IV pilus assembly protein PilB